MSSSYTILFLILLNFYMVTFAFICSEAKFKEFEPRLQFKLRLKYDWFHSKLYSIFQDLSRRSIETGFWGIWDEA